MQNTNPRIFAFTGQKGSGKTEAVKVFVEEFVKLGVKVAELNIADDLKEIACRVLNLTPEELEKLKRLEELGFVATGVSGASGSTSEFYSSKTVRQFLQDLGEAVKVVTGNEYVWVGMLVDKIHQIDADVVIISDVRFPFEAEVLSRNFDTTIIKIDRPSLKSDDKHPSETNIQNVPANFVLTNRGDSLENYREDVKDLFDYIGGHGDYEQEERVSEKEYQNILSILRDS